MKKLTEDDLIGMRDTFTDLTGAVVPSDPDDMAFIIVAGPWPNDNDDAISVQCKACGDSAGLSPKGYRLHLRNSERPILCGSCFVALNNFLTEMGEA